MTWFRTPCLSVDPPGNCSGELDPDKVREVIEDALRPDHFFIAPGLSLEWDHVNEEIPWEIFHCRLLDRTHTRLHASFESWNLYQAGTEGRSAEPLLSVKLDLPARQVHVTRALYCHAWEGYDAGDNVYLSREVNKWVRELGGTLHLDRLPTVAEFRDELMCRLFQAVVGASRLPLTSVEAPLPAFSLGQLGYFYHREGGPGRVRSCRDLIAWSLHGDLSWREKARLLEVVLRCLRPEEVEPAADLFVRRWQELGQSPAQLQALLRTLFNETALSPWTGFVDRTLAFLEWLEAGNFLTTEDRADFLGYLLRNLARHLTAYDLTTFHHRGANYPDALLLDAALGAYLHLAEHRSELFTSEVGETEAARSRKRRRALRQGWMLRRFYEGLPVPDAPTSPGENIRILPPPYSRVPEEQILDPARRTRRLFAGDPLPARLGPRAHSLLRQSLQDLEHPRELQELGLAVFLDRPLGVFKAPGEPDQTLLLSYEAFSRSIAERRLRFLAEDTTLEMTLAEWERYRERLYSMAVQGVSLTPRKTTTRPEVVSLQDAFKAAPDFVFLRTTGLAVRAFLDQFPLVSPEEVNAGVLPLILRAADLGEEREDVLVILDSMGRKCLELQVQARQGYGSRGGTEYPAGGLTVIRAWGPDGQAGSKVSVSP